jgi:hypothetical protein
MTASAVSLGWILAGAERTRTLFRSARAAALTASVIRMRDSSKKVRVPTLGFWMMSTAPASMARSMVSDPASVRVEHMNPRKGCWLMIFCAEVMGRPARHLTSR